MVANYRKEQQYLKAQKRIKDIKGFYSHLIVMVFLLPFIVFINLKFIPRYQWFWWALFGNLFGLFFHWLGVFGFENLGLGKKWEEKKIQEYINKDKTNF